MTEPSSLKRRAKREAKRIQEGGGVETAGEQTAPLDEERPQTPGNTSEVTQTPDSPSDYMLKTPPIRAHDQRDDNAIEEDGEKWDNCLGEINAGESGWYSTKTLTTNKLSGRNVMMLNKMATTPQQANGQAEAIWTTGQSLWSRAKQQTPRLRDQYMMQRHLSQPPRTGQGAVMEQQGGTETQPEGRHEPQPPPYQHLSNNDLTPIPEGGYPRLHGWNNQNVFAGVDQEIIEEWKMDGVCKCFIYPYNAGMEVDRSMMAGRLQATIARLFGAQDIQVGEPLGPCNGAQRLPWLYIAATPLEVAQELTRRSMWLTPEVTFFAIPFAPEISTYTFTMANMRVAANEEGCRKITELVSRTMKASQQLLDLIAKQLPQDEEDFEAITLAEVLYHHAKLISATPLTIAHPKNAGDEVLWNIYISPLSQNILTNNEWVMAIKRLRFYIPYMSVGTVRSFKCARCKSVDHPMGLCPFPRVPGWLGAVGDVQQQNRGEQMQGINTAMRGSGLRAEVEVESCNR